MPETVIASRTQRDKQKKPNQPDYRTAGNLRVQEIMSREMVTVASTDTVFMAARQMSENKVSCVIVVDDQMVIGILTDKDILKGIAGNDREFHHLRVEERMSSPVQTVGPDISIVQAGQIMEDHGIKRLPVVDGGTLLGIITQTDITRGLVSISPLKAVSDIMTAEVASVSAAASVAEAAQMMATQGISCLIATHHQSVAGIITEKDLLRRVVALRKDPAEVKVVDVMSFPIVAVPPDYSILSAARKMDLMHLHRLVVMADNQISGVVTQTDIARAVRTELERLEQARRMSTVELNRAIDDVVAGLGRLQVLLNETSYLLPLSANPDETTPTED